MHGPFQGAVNIFISIILLCFLKEGLKFHKLQIHEVYIFSGYKIAYKHDSIFKVKILISIHNEKFYSKTKYLEKERSLEQVFASMSKISDESVEKVKKWADLFM